ncbi:MAG TPA: hypothetical protein PLI48_03685 [Gammaproteobacteria bacterium]|nr:hypothetical protein [Gammaproteobacteria bacterium]HRP87861.1 hypothetical protein [Gammaproteobacteria bacterium]
MNDWLKLMLEEIRRKQREREQASREHQRRGSGPGAPAPTGPRSPGAGRRD